MKKYSPNLDFYLDKVVEPLTREEEYKLLNKIKKTKDENKRNKLKEKILHSNNRFVRSYVKRYQKYYVKCPSLISYNDLYSEALIGMWESIDKFDYKMGYRFLTYATNWMKQKIYYFIYKNNTILKIPQTKQYQMNGGNDKRHSADQFEFNYFLIADDGEMFEPTDKITDVNNEVENNELKENIIKILNNFKDRDKEIMILRYGLNGEKPLTLEKLGNKYGISKEAIRIIIGRILFRIKRDYSNVLKGYVRETRIRGYYSFVNPNRKDIKYAC